MIPQKTAIAIFLGLAGLAVAMYFYKEQPPQAASAAHEANSNASLPSGADSKNSPDKNRLEIRDGSISVPKRYQLPGVDHVRSASNFNDWLAQFPADQQTKISAFDLRHFGMYSINSREQVAWMANMGYPMPEDVIVAADLSDEALRDLARGGNDKAGFLLHERNMDALQARFAELANQDKGQSAFWDNDPAAAQFQKDEQQYSQLLQDSASPFKGFVKAQGAAFDEDQGNAPATVISGLLWAETFGDFRVDQLVQTYVGNDPIRKAMLAGALSMGIDSGGADIAALRKLGCPGFNVGQPIPGLSSAVR